MFRKLLLPIAAAALLGGCATTGDYNYRGGAGDYYYGNPGVDYRYHRSPYGYYPYGYGSYSRFGLSGYYGHPYYGHYGYPYYGHPYYGHPYYGYPYRRPIVIVQPRPGDGTGTTPPRNDNDDRPPPWRDLNARRRNQLDPGGSRQALPEPARPMRPSYSDSGSRMEQMMRRSREAGVRPSSSTEEP